MNIRKKWFWWSKPLHLSRVWLYKWRQWRHDSVLIPKVSLHPVTYSPVNKLTGYWPAAEKGQLTRTTGQTRGVESCDATTQHSTHHSNAHAMFTTWANSDEPSQCKHPCSTGPQHPDTIFFFLNLKHPDNWIDHTMNLLVEKHFKWRKNN